jgi:hypothetical protein
VPVSPRVRTILVNAAIALLGVAPALISLAVRKAAANLGCQLDDSIIHPCLSGGGDIGRSLHAWGMAWVFLIVTVPLSLTAAAVYNIVRPSRRAKLPSA